MAGLWEWNPRLRRSIQSEAAFLRGGGGGDGVSSEAEFGFGRPEMGKEALAGTVQPYDRHVFLCYKTPAIWPSHIEDGEFERLPRLFSAAFAARNPHIKKRTRLTLCEGENGTDSSNGDILIFPDMIKYRRLTHFDVDDFVDEVLVKDSEWLHGAAKTLRGAYIFVCAHGSRDRRCGVCGPILIKRFEKEISSRDLQEQVYVSPCSHIGGHKYAGNVIIFSSSSSGEVTGHWYGYVTPEDVPILLDQHIGKGNIVDHLWRGQMGSSEEDQKQAQKLRLDLNSVVEENSAKEFMQTGGTDDVVHSVVAAAGGCCQNVGNAICCQNGSVKEKEEKSHAGDQDPSNVFEMNSNRAGKVSSDKGSGTRRVYPMPTWFETWECEDTYAVIAVVAAIASVYVAYSCLQQLK